MDTYEFTFPGGSAIITTTTGGTKEDPDFSVRGSEGRSHTQIFAAEILRLADRNERLETHLAAFLDFYDGEEDPNPLLFFDIMHARAEAIRRDLKGE